MNRLRRIIGGKADAETPSMDWLVRPLPKPEPLIPAPTAMELDVRYLTHPPAAPQGFEPLHPFRGHPLTLEEVRTIPRSLIVDPIGTLDPNIPIEMLRRENFVVGFTDLRWEFGDVFGEWTPSVTREAMLWCRTASRVYFTSETDRRLAIEKYGIEPERACICPVLSLISLPEAEKSVREKLDLPSQYILGSLSDSPQVNSVLLVQAIQLFRQRDVELPPLVLMEPLRTSPVERKSLRMRKLLDESKTNSHSLGELTPQERAGVIASASLLIDTHRGTGRAAVDLGVAMRHGVPAIACDSPLMRVQWGHLRPGLKLIHPDDPVALANAIRRIMDSQFGSSSMRRAG